MSSLFYILKKQKRQAFFETLFEARVKIPLRRMITQQTDVKWVGVCICAQYVWEND